MGLYQLTRHVRTTLVAAAILSLSVSAFAQSGQSSLATTAQAFAAQAAAQAEPTGPVRRLSVDDAVKSALEQNLGIRIQRIDPQIQDLGIAQAKSLWTPNLTSSLSRNSVSTPAQGVLNPTSLTGTLATGVGMNQQLPWGGNYSANWNNQRSTTTNIYSNYSPLLTSNLSLNYAQPLLQNFSIDQIRDQVQLSQKTRDLSDITLQQVIINTTRSVKDAYWDLSYAIANLKAQQQSLKLSQQSLKDNQKRVEIGTMAPIDIVQAQAEVASNEQGVIIAQAAIKTAEDTLRTMIFDPAAPDFWTVSLDPTDAPVADAQAVDVNAAVRNALTQRTDLRSAKNSLEQSDVNIRYFRNQILPAVNALVGYGTQGVGGAQLTPVQSLSQAAAARSIIAQSGYGSVLSDVIGSAYPQWSAGVQIGYPIGRSVSEANLARARLQYQQAQTQMKNLEMQVAMQVRLAARNVETNQQRIRSAAASRALQEKKLEAEEKKLAAGMSSSFLVFQAQRDLSLARVTEIQAIADYNKSLVDYEAVQLVPINGSIGTLTTAGTGAIQAGGTAIIRQ